MERGCRLTTNSVLPALDLARIVTFKPQRRDNRPRVIPETDPQGHQLVRSLHHGYLPDGADAHVDLFDNGQVNLRA